MNRKLNYCQIFLLFMISLLLATGIASASDVTDNNEVSDNTQIESVSNDAPGIIQEDSTIDTKSIENDMKKTKDNSDNKLLVKDDKNLKSSIREGTLTANQSSAKAGESINLHLYCKGTAIKSTFTYDVTVKLNDTTFYTGSLTPSESYNAYVDVVVPDLEAGEYILFMEINYNNAYRGANGTTPFTVLKTIKSTKIVDVGEITTQTGNVLIPINVIDVNGEAVTGSSTITVKDGLTVLVDNYPIEEGVATINVPTVRCGDYDLTVEFAGNDDYLNCSTIIPVSISKAATTLTVNQVDTDDELIYQIINAGDNTVVSGSLIQTTINEAISNAEIKVTANGKEYIILTDNEGMYSFKYNVTQLASNIPLTVSFSGDELYLPSKVFYGSFDIEVLEAKITLDENPLSEVNETTTITGKVTDKNNNPVADAEVNLIINDDEASVVTTDDEGNFSYNIIFNDTIEVNVVASMKNQEVFEADSASISFNSIVGPRRTNLTVETGLGSDNTIDIVDVTPYLDEVITNGTLTDIFNEPVADAKINILINGEYYSVTTDNEGKFSFIFNATEGLTTYDITIRFEGNDAYKKAGEVYTGIFTTKAFDITVLIDDNFPDEILVGDNVTITGSATLQNEALKNNEIKLRINKVNYYTTTDDEGRYSYVYTPTTYGFVTITAGATFENANIQTAKSKIYVDYPPVQIELSDKLNNTTVFSDVNMHGTIRILTNNTPIQDNLSVTVNGKKTSIESDMDGYFTYTFKADTVGRYNISIEYTSNRYYVYNYTDSINVSKREVELVSDKLPIAVKVNDVFTISGKLLDQTNTPVTNAEITFIINNQRFSNLTDRDGQYAYHYQTTNVGDNNLYEVRYSGDDNYILAKNYVGSFFDVERVIVNPKITVTIENTTLNVATTITGTVKDAYGNFLSNVNVKVNVEDEEFTATTNDEGAYSLSYTPTRVGKYNVNVSIDDEDYIFKVIKAEFEVNKENTSINIEPVVVSSTFDANLTAHVVDSNNNPVNAGKIVFKINGKTAKDADGKVIYVKAENGQATITYTFTKEDIDKNVSITAFYSGTVSYASSVSDKTNVLKSDNHSLNMIMDDVTAAQGQTTTIAATLKDYDENINTGKVIFKINGKTLKDATGKVIYTHVQDGTASVEYTILNTTKAKEYTLTAIFMDSFYNRTQTTAKLTVTENENNTNISDINTTANLKTESGNVIIITNDNIDEYITANGLTDLVNPGDTIDIQGTIDKQNSLVINKPVNVISSTKDAIISLHTNAGSYFGEDPGNCFVVNNAGSGSNISNLYLYNTECWMFNNYDVTLYNMTMYVKEARVGSGVGQTAIRYCERMIIDSCYIYTEANGGSTSVALTGSSDVLIKNTTIEGRYGANQVGNILYLANPYNTGDMPEGFVMRNTNITMIGSTIKGECIGAITEGVRNFASNCTFINNTINTTGLYGFLDTGKNGVAIGNKFYNEGRLIVQAKCNASENVFYGTGNLTAKSNANIYNNIITNLLYDTYANYTNNTIENVIMYEGMILANQTITGNVYVDSKRLLTETVNNVIIANNSIGGDIILYGGSSSKRVTNTMITNNTIGGNITLTQAISNNILNNTINGSIINGNNAFRSVIENNTIVTANEYAITTQKAANITGNYIISDNYQKIGDDGILDSSGESNITGNGPDSSELWIVSFEDVTATVGEYSEIIIHLTDPITREDINEGEVYLMINDEIITDENGYIIKADILSSQAMFDLDISTGWLRSDAVITAVFTSGTITKSNSTYMTILKRNANVEITTEELTITPGQTVTLTAAVTDLKTGEDLSGQLTFKINGLSLEDNDGKLICVDVVDGIATLEYTFDDDVAPGTYTLSTVFENTYYVRSTDDKTLIIE